MQDCHSTMICNAMISHWPRNTIGNSMDPADWLDFVDTPRGRSSPSTAVPNAGSITFVMSRNLCSMCKYIVSHLTNNNGYKFVKFTRRDDMICVSNGSFIHPKDHVFQSCLSYIQPAANIDLRTLAHGMIQFENKNFLWLGDCCSSNNPSIWVVIISLEISSMPTQTPQGKHDFSRTWTWLRATPSLLTLGSPLPSVLRLISLSWKRF